jgi:hypothetical protein
MEEQQFENLTTGAEVYTNHGVRVGTLVAVHTEPPGYVEIEDERPGGGRHIHLPLTEVLNVQPNRVIVELDPDIVTSHDRQWIPDKP